jgi:hypothetical protein
MIGLVVALVCYVYPLKYLICTGVANLYYIMHYWLFWGKDGIATRFPVLPALPVLILYALGVGAVLGLLAYGVYLLANTYRGKTLQQISRDQ